MLASAIAAKRADRPGPPDGDLYDTLFGPPGR
jgi:hypothetical protein